MNFAPILFVLQTSVRAAWSHEAGRDPAGQAWNLQPASISERFLFAAAGPERDYHQPEVEDEDNNEENIDGSISSGLLEASVVGSGQSEFAKMAVVRSQSLDLASKLFSSHCLKSATSLPSTPSG